MAQTGYTPISIYYSATSTNVPTAGNLVAGELAINTADGKLFYKDSAGVVQTIASKSAAALANSTTGTGATVLATNPTITNPALAGATSGSVTLAVPAVAGSNTATLPAATGTVMVSGNMPAFSAYLGSAQSYSSNTYTKIQFNTEEFDTANCFDSTTNYRFTPNVAGYYQINLMADVSVGTYFELDIFKNGSRFKSTQNTGYFAITVSSIIYMNGTTDYLEGYVFITGVGSLTTGSVFTVFSGSLVRAA